VAVNALLTQAVRKRADVGGNFFQDLLIELRLVAIWIGDIPVFDFFGLAEEGIGAPAAEIDDHVGVVPSVAGDGSGGKALGGIAVGMKSLQSESGNMAQGKKAGAGGINDVRSITKGDGFGYGTAAGIADADEEDPGLTGEGHEEIVACIGGNRGKGVQ